MLYTQANQARQVISLDGIWRFRKNAVPYVIGTHIWAFADFRTAESISRIIDNRKGVFTRTREPKLAAHTVEKMWTDSNS